MIAIIIVAFIAGIAVGVKIGGERAVRNIAERERQMLRERGGLKK